MTDPETETRERISARDYWNIAGRAGRAGEETEGTIIHIVATAQDARDYEHYRLHRELDEPLTSALFDLLEGLAENRLDRQSVADDLDADVLALLVEEAYPLETLEDADALVSASLVGVQASERQRSPRRLAEIVLETADNARTQVPTKYRRAYSETGLTVRSCEQLREHIVANSDFIAEQLWRTGVGDLRSVCEFLLGALLGLDEIQSDREVAADHADILTRWIAGENVTSIAVATGLSEDIQSLSRFIEDVFSYRLPWGTAGYATIAAAVLEHETQPADVIASLPAMMKYGVPTAEASWAMSAGIPTRALATRMALDFISTGLEGPSEFRRWLGRHGIEGLAEQYDVEGSLLYETARALLRNTDNPHLREYSGIDSLLPWTVDVRISRRAIDAGYLAPLQPEHVLRLVRDYDSLIDRNAVEVRDEDRLLGWLPRTVAQTLAPEIDSSLEVSATVKVSSDGESLEIVIARVG